jgi:integrase/recombinase XerD
MSIPEPILVVYSEPPKAIATTDLRQARVDEFLASRSLQPKSRKAYQADLRTFMDWRSGLGGCESAQSDTV